MYLDINVSVFDNIILNFKVIFIEIKFFVYWVFSFLF